MKLDFVVRVAVENTAYSFDKDFDYAVPDRLEKDCVAGARVLVPFGRGNRRRQGIITEVLREDNSSLKEIISVLDDEPVLSAELLAAAKFMKEHYFCTTYEAVKTMLPAGVNYKVTTVYGIKSSDFDSELEVEEQRLYDYLHSKRKAVRLEKILDDFGLSDSRLPDQMVEKGLLYKSDEAFRKVNDAVMKMAAISPTSIIPA